MGAKFHPLAYATAVVVVVFAPQFTLPGIEARLFTPLGYRTKSSRSSLPCWCP